MEVVFLEKFPDLRVTFSKRKFSKLTAITSLCKTIFLCALLMIGAMMFIQDANNLVLIPIERMLEIVKLLAKNPLAAAKEDFTKKGMI